MTSQLFWSNLNPSGTPPARFSGGLRFFPPISQSILFGGQSAPGGTFLNDTNAYDSKSNAWTSLSPANSPPAMDGFGLAYDPNTQQIILFGGFDGNTQLNTTWAYGPENTWTNQTATTVTASNTPSARNEASMSYDPIIGKIILFGGYSTTDLNDTWSYDSAANTWTQLFPTSTTTLPPVRDSARMVFDPVSGTTILFGGYSDGTNLNDTWSYNSSTNVWTDLTPNIPTSPSPRYGFTLNLDLATNTIVLFGGAFYPDVFYNDTWTFSSATNTWTQLTLTTSPDAREFAMSTFDHPSNSIVMFAGVNNNASPQTYQDTWGLCLGIAPTITSANTCTFYSNDGENSFTVTSTGSPTPSLTVAGPLPTGVTFVDNGDGTGTLTGSTSVVPGSYSLSFTATNGIGTPATQPFTLIVDIGTAPTITSANSAIFYAGDIVNTFTVETTGIPTPAIHLSGNLPSGITFTDNGDGTGTLSGTTSDTGIFPFQFLVNNFVFPEAAQNFTLVVEQGVAPEFTSASTATYVINTAFSFTVTTLGYPIPTLSEFGALPPGVTFVDNGNGTGTLSGMTTETGTFDLTFTATNGISSGSTQNFILTLITALPPIDIHSIRTERECERNDDHGHPHDHKHYFNVLVWGAPINSSPIASYTIYRSKNPGYPGPPIANVIMPGALYFIDPICKKKSYTYYITSTDTSNNVSIPAIFKVRWK